MEFDPDVVVLFAAMKATNTPTIDTLAPREARMLYRSQSDRVGGPDVAMGAVTAHAARGPAGAIPLRLYRPHGVGESGAPLLLFLHGGGWVIGDLDSHDKVCRQLAERAECLVLAVGYRLAPEHPAPAAAEDAIAALAWTFEHAMELGADPARIAICGDSAGGNLSAVAALAARDRGLPLRAQILIYPAVDRRPGDFYPSRATYAEVPPLTRKVMDWFSEKYLPDDAKAEDWRLSPLLAPVKAGLAPAMVIVAERDSLHDEGLAYADALDAAGVPVTRVVVPGMIHGFITMGGMIRATARVLDQIAAELRERLA